MKKQRLIIASLIILLVWGVVFLIHTQENIKKMASIHELHQVLTYTEQKGADYAVDRLDYLIVYSYTKDDLLQKWGMPNESTADTEADVWLLSNKNQLAVYYDTDGEVRKIEVQSLQN